MGVMERKEKTFSIQLSFTINSEMLFISIAFQSDVDHQVFKISILF